MQTTVVTPKIGVPATVGTLIPAPQPASSYPQQRWTNRRSSDTVSALFAARATNMQQTLRTTRGAVLVDSAADYPAMFAARVASMQQAVHCQL